jgi:hypothetical protein
MRAHVFVKMEEWNMEKEKKETRRQSPSEMLREIPENEYKSLLSLLDIIEDVGRRERRPTYTSYFVNMVVNAK